MGTTDDDGTLPSATRPHCPTTLCIVLFWGSMLALANCRSDSELGSKNKVSEY